MSVIDMNAIDPEIRRVLVRQRQLDERDQELSRESDLVNWIDDEYIRFAPDLHPRDDGHVQWYDKTGLAHPPGKPSRELRYLQLRGDEKNPRKKLGEINAILEAEGYSEVSGEGVMPCPTRSHEIVRENKGAKSMIGEL